MKRDKPKSTPLLAQIVFVGLIAIIGLSFSLQNASDPWIESTIQSDSKKNMLPPPNSAGTTYDFSINHNQGISSDWATYWTWTPDRTLYDKCTRTLFGLNITSTQDAVDYSYLTRNIDLVSENITHAKIDIAWSGKLAQTTSRAVWEIYDGTTATEFTNTLKTNTDTWGSMMAPELVSLDLDSLIDGTETQLYIRLKTRLLNQFNSDSHVLVFSFTLAVFTSQITDSGNYNELQTNYNISVSLDRNGTDSGLDTSLSHYKLYFAFGSTAQPVTTSSKEAYAVNWQGFTGDHSNFFFQINGDNFTADGVLTFRFYIDDPDVVSKYYFSPTYSATIEDNHLPKFDGNKIYYNGTSDKNYVRHECDLNLTMPVNDTGESKLDRAWLYWRIGGNAFVGINDGSLQYTFSPKVNVGNISFILPETAFNATVGLGILQTGILVIISDGSGNNGSYSFLLDVYDKVKPIGNFISSSPSSHILQYNGTLTLTYQIIEDFDGRGLLETNAVQLRWKVAHNQVVEAPVDENDYNGYYYFPYGYNAYDRTFTFYLELYAFYESSENFQYNDTVYFWVMATDRSLNVGNSTFNDLYYLNDTAAPICNPVGTTISPAGYNEDKALTFQITEIYNAKSAGANVSYSRENSYLKINNTGANIKLNFTDSGDQIMTTIQKSLLHYTDTLYLYIHVKDYANNTISRNFTIYVADIYAPIISVLTDYAHTNITFARTNYDLLFAVDAADFPGGSDLKNVSLKINFDTAVNWNAVSTTYLYQTVSGTQFSFVIPSNVLVISSGTSRLLHYTFRAYDKDGNQFDMNGSVNILKQGVPSTPYVDLGGRLESYFNSRTWNLTTRLDTDCIVNIFVDGQQVNEVPYSGKNIVHLMNFPADGSYNVTIRYFNQSWSKIVVIDTIAPTAVDVSTVRCVYENGGINITWSAPASDVYIYYVFRGTTENFALADGIRIIDVTDCRYFDTDVGPGIYYYRIVAVDRALNLAEGSTSVKVEVPLPAYTPYVIGAGAAVGVIGSALGLRKRKMKKMTLNERGIKRNLASESNKSASKSDNYWDMAEEGAEAPKKEDNTVWKDISSDGWTQSMTAARQTAPSATPTNSLASSVPKTSSVAAAGATLGADPTARFDAEMQGIYRNAQEFVDLGQDSMAIQSYSMLLRLAEKRNDAAMIAFIKGKIDQL